PSGPPSAGGTAVGFGSVVPASTRLLPWVRTGWPAAATAAGFVEVWSTIRLLMTRGCASKTVPFFCFSYDEPGGPKPGGTLSASRKFFAERRGKTWSDAAKVSRPG